MPKNNDFPRSVTSSKKKTPKVNGELPPIKKFQISFYLNSKNKIGSVVVEARDEQDAIQQAGQLLRIDIQKYYG